ncbi:hypothetical protein [Nonomuraea guangzhouensis]|uniref:Uncharacterized protein n=1 Tax=Nonomuraea guangzhouensis TaxID=1291555 RepID=A0ABW4GXX4_9ACTN|nr:hypothetical protein [Nonomuraea guangzhouensis]
MQPPDNKKNGPQGRTPEARTEKNKAAQPVEALSSATVQAGGAEFSTSEQTALLALFADNPLGVAARVIPRSRSAFADLWAPDAPAGRRTMWTLVFRCPLCHCHHIGRAESIEAARGKRRAGCGRIVRIRIRRVYDARPVQAVSA